MKAKTNTEDINKLSLAPRLSNVDCAARFVKCLPKAKDGTNSYVSDFMSIAFIVMNNYERGFSLDDFVNLSKSREIPADEIKRLFSLWTSQLLKWGRLKKLESCYDQEMFRVI